MVRSGFLMSHEVSNGEVRVSNGVQSTLRYDK